MPRIVDLPERHVKGHGNDTLREWTSIILMTSYDHMHIARIKGERREVRRALAGESRRRLGGYRKGLEMVQGDPQATIEQWQQALESLQGVLELAPKDENALYNHELIKKQLEELQKQQEEKQQQKQQVQIN